MAYRALHATLLVVLGVAGTGIVEVWADIDPITASHPVWFVPEGAAKVDGVIEEAEWRGAYDIVRTQAWRRGRIRVQIMHDSLGLYVATRADDEYLWADGEGGGAGNRWDVGTDDSITFYFDPNRSRNQFLQETDRGFGINLGNLTDPINGSGVVRRWAYFTGDGAGGSKDVIPGGAPDSGIIWASSYDGSINNNSDRDIGWSTEIFLPWSALNMSPPAHGDTIGMNFDLIFDNDGGGRNFTDNRNNPDPKIRLGMPAFIDDHVQGAHSSYSGSQAGRQGPVNYAELMFLGAASAERPAPVADIQALNPSAHGAGLAFTAPAGTGGGKGHAAGYEIRVSANPIADESAWNAATPIANRYVPQPRGEPELLRIAGLNPATTYHVAVRARDARGVLGALGNSRAFTTAATGPVRIIPDPNGSGLVFEDGSPFIPVGEHMGLSWGYFRTLYPGDVWDPSGKEFHDFHASPSFEGPVGPHLDAIKAKGVNTLRVFLELLGLDQTGNSFAMPKGRYWLEYPAYTYNPDMRQFILNALQEAAARNMYLIFSPFENFSWNIPVVFTQETPWYTGNGGPLSDINDFYQNPSTDAQVKARLKQVIDWVNESPYKDHLIGWEAMNEWDSTGWTQNAEGDKEPGRESEMRRRALYVKGLNQFIRDNDPAHLVLSSTTARDPRGPLARVVFYDRSVDVLVPHFYTNSSEEPQNNPEPTHKEVMPAEENGLLGSYWLTHRADHRPLLNGEWGMTRAKWPSQKPAYGASFTQAQDEALFRTISWSGVATGQAGQGLRIATDELMPNLASLTDGMRLTQQKMAAVFGSAVVRSLWRGFAAETLEGGMEVVCPDMLSARPRNVKTFGTHDGYGAGLVYLLVDHGNGVSAECPSPAQARLVLSRFPNARQYTAEVWTTTGAGTAPVAAGRTALSFGGRVGFDLAGVLGGATGDGVLVFRQGTATTTGAPVPIGIDPATRQGSAGQPAQKTCASSDPPCDYHYRFIAPGTGSLTVSRAGGNGCLRVYDGAGVLLGQGSGSCGAGSASGDSGLALNVKQGEEYFVLVADEAAGGHAIKLDASALLAGDSLKLNLNLSAGSGAAGGRVLYTATVANAGSATVRGIVAVFDVAGGKVLYSPQGCSYQYKTPGFTMLCPLDDLAVGGVATLRFAVSPDTTTLSAAGKLYNPATGEYPATAPDLSTPVSPTGKKDRTAANLRLAIAGPGTAKANKALKYTLKVKNLGPGAAPGVEVLASLPQGAAWSTQDPRCQPVAEGMLCAVGDIPSKRTVAVPTGLSFKTPAKVVYVARAVAAAGDPKPSNNGASLKIRVR